MKVKIVLKLIRFEIVLLNGQVSDWSDVRAGVHQGSILGPLLFLIYTNDLSEALSSNAKVFADDTSLFPLIYDSKKAILKFIRPSPNNIFECHNPQGTKFLTRLWSREQKFKHSFQDLLNSICKCGAEVESTAHFLLHCAIHNNDRSSLLSAIRNIDCKLLEITDSSLT